MRKLNALIIITCLCSHTVLNSEPQAQHCFENLAASGKWVMAIVQRHELKNLDGLKILAEHLEKAVRSCLMLLKAHSLQQSREGSLAFPFDFRSANECIKALRAGVERLSKAGHNIRGHLVKDQILVEMARLGLDFSEIQRKCI